MSSPVFYPSFCFFIVGQIVKHLVGICWAQSSEDEHSRACIWSLSGASEDRWGVGGKSSQCLQDDHTHFFILVKLEDVNGFSDCLNMEMRVFKRWVNGETLQGALTHTIYLACFHME